MKPSAAVEVLVLLRGSPPQPSATATPIVSIRTMPVEHKKNSRLEGVEETGTERLWVLGAGPGEGGGDDRGWLCKQFTPQGSGRWATHRARGQERLRGDGLDSDACLHSAEPHVCARAGAVLAFIEKGQLRGAMDRPANIEAGL